MSFEISTGLWGPVSLPLHTRWVLGQPISEVEGLTLAPLDSGPQTQDAVLPLIGAPEQAPALGPGPRESSRLSLGPKIEARDQWDQRLQRACPHLLNTA